MLRFSLWLRAALTVIGALSTHWLRSGQVVLTFALAALTHAATLLPEWFPHLWWLSFRDVATSYTSARKYRAGLRPTCRSRPSFAQRHRHVASDGGFALISLAISRAVAPGFSAMYRNARCLMLMSRRPRDRPRLFPCQRLRHRFEQKRERFGLCSYSTSHRCPHSSHLLTTGCDSYLAFRRCRSIARIRSRFRSLYRRRVSRMRSRRAGSRIARRLELRL